MKTIKSFGIALLLLLVSTTVSAQCTFRNTAFKSGEFLTYNLYYNWKFVWVKAGNASMSIVQTTRHGKHFRKWRFCNSLFIKGYDSC